MSPLDDYIDTHIDPEPEELRRIDRLTNIRLLNGRMCSGHTQGRLLKMFVRMIRPRRVLELGTFSGYSALCMAEGLEPGASIDTIEIDDELEDFIRHNLSTSPHGSKVRLHIGDAVDIMRGMPRESFDLIFIDADKKRYGEYYDAAFPLIRPGGYIIADNTLWDGHVTESSPHSAMTRGIMHFNDKIAADKRVEKVILPLRDGLTIIRVVPPVNDIPPRAL